MPGPITHLKVAHYYNVKHGNKLGGLLYLGSICPDSVNINGHAPKEIRWPAHLRHSDLDRWEQNAERFYNENKGTVDEAYLKGYILHILTDIVWDLSFDWPLYTVMLKSGIAPEDLKSERWNELYGFEQIDCRNKWFTDEVLPLLTDAKAEDIGTLKKETVTLWQEKVVSLQLDSGKTPCYVDEKLINDLISEVFLLAERIFV